MHEHCIDDVFLMVAWIFYARSMFVPAMVPYNPVFFGEGTPKSERYRRLFAMREKIADLFPLLLIGMSVASYVVYLGTIDAFIDQNIRTGQTIKQLLQDDGTHYPVARQVYLQVYYLGIFVFAEAAFVEMALSPLDLRRQGASRLRAALLFTMKRILAPSIPIPVTAPSPAQSVVRVGAPRTNVYVDGFNLYYGAAKNTPYKWVNLAALCAVVLPGINIRRIRYFTALVRATAADPNIRQRQETYIRALETLPSLTVHYGHYLQSTESMRLANPQPGDLAMLTC